MKSRILLLLLLFPILFFSCKLALGPDNPQKSDINQKPDLSKIEDAVVSIDGKFIVYAESDGLHIYQGYDSKYVNLTINVFDCDEGNINYAIISYDKLRRVFVYPFVSPDKSYSVNIELNNADWDWWKRISTETLTVKAKGGLGDAKVSYSDISYDGDKKISVNDYERHLPKDISFDWTSFAGCSVWQDGIKSYFNYNHNFWEDGYSDTPEKENYFELDKALDYVNQNVLNGTDDKRYFFVRIEDDFSYEGIRYSYLFDSCPACFKYGKKGTIVLSGDENIGVTASEDGLILVKYDSRFFRADGKFTIENVSTQTSCPVLFSDADPDFEQNRVIYEYPFTQAGNEYEVTLESTFRYTNETLKYKSVRITALGGLGDFAVNYSSINYNQNGENVASVIFNDFGFTPQNLDLQNKTFSGKVYLSGTEYARPLDVSFENGILDLKKYLGFIRGKTFGVNLGMEFEWGGSCYKYDFPISEASIFTDEHPDITESYSLILSRNYEEIKDFGTYGVSRENYQKKAFLITYNNSDEKVPDNKYASTDFDCIRCDWPKGNVVRDNSRRAAGGDPDYSAYVIGSTKKTFDGFEATLAGIGQKCNIWIYNNKKETFDEINEMIKDEQFSYSHMAELFDSYFDIVTYVFGSNIPKEQYSNIITVTPKTKIDLFICDFVTAGFAENDNLLGFYRGGNMYTKEFVEEYNLNYPTNACEMVYINADSVSNYGFNIMTTVLHEFQHLLCDVNKGSYSSDYTEMMSTTCENIMQTLYETPYLNNELIRSRIEEFNGGYMAGIINWAETSYNYGVDGAFMDFVMRNYGGVELLRTICHNDEYGYMDAVIAGLETMGYTETFDSLMKKFALCTVNAGKTPETAIGGITANKYITSSMNTGSQDVKFELMPINYNDYGYYNQGLYNDEDRYELKYFDDESGLGPSILDINASMEELWPKSFVIKFLGQYLETITIEQPESSDYEFMIVFMDQNPDLQVFQFKNGTSASFTAQ